MHIQTYLCKYVFYILDVNVSNMCLLWFQKSEYLWRKVFFVSSGLYFFTNLLYLILGTSELAEWNDPKIHEEIEEVDTMIKKNEEREEKN